MRAIKEREEKRIIMNCLEGEEKERRKENNCTGEMEFRDLRKQGKQEMSLQEL